MKVLPIFISIADASGCGCGYEDFLGYWMTFPGGLEQHLIVLASQFRESIRNDSVCDGIQAAFELFALGDELRPEGLVHKALRCMDEEGISAKAVTAVGFQPMVLEQGDEQAFRPFVGKDETILDDTLGLCRADSAEPLLQARHGLSSGVFFSRRRRLGVQALNLAKFFEEISGGHGVVVVASNDE